MVLILNVVGRQGVGKSNHANRLAAGLRANGRHVTVIDEEGYRDLPTLQDVRARACCSASVVILVGEKPHPDWSSKLPSDELIELTR